ncbi:MAG: hypothetical protein IPG70_15985 [Moraxellaceae bacterium]|nr:hypothetical protein [Moraxellaceae bacterium]
MTTALLTGLLAASGVDGNGAGTDAQNQANKLPIANADFFNVLQGNTATLNVLANDIDPELAINASRDADY